MTQVHTVGSLHYKGRAADLVGSEAEMANFVRWAIKTHTADITELIHNPGGSIDNRKIVPSSVWGASVWAAHADHVHFAI